MSYNWIPAGYTDATQMVAYVKEKKVITSDFFVKNELNPMEVHPNGIRTPSSLSRLCIELPDRTIWTSYDDIVPIKRDFDYCVHLNFRKEGHDHIQIPYSLISAENALTQKIKSIDKDPKHKIFGDSGGAQLRFSSSCYVNPYEVIEVFNNLVDMGVSLDMGPRSTDSKYGKLKNVINATSEAQIRNNKIFAENAREDLHLLNVIQGFGLQTKLDWADRVYNPRFTGWAMGVPEHALAVKMLSIMHIALNVPGDHYHLFGVGGAKSIISLSWAGRYVNNLTSDSTKHIMLGGYRSYVSSGMNGKFSIVDLGKVRTNLPNNRMAMLPCNCAACSLLRYSKIFNLSGPMLGPLLMYHNAVAISNNANFWANLARTVKDKHEYLYYVREATAMPNGRTSPIYIEIEAAVNVIDCCVFEGSLQAEKRYCLDKKGDYVSGFTENKLSCSFEQIKNTTTDIKKEIDLDSDESEEGEFVNIQAGKTTSVRKRWSICCDVLPRYLTKKELLEFGIDPKTSYGYAEWKKNEKQRKKRNILQAGNIWVSKYLEHLKGKGLYPIVYNDERGVAKEYSLSALDTYWKYPMTLKRIKKIQKIILHEVIEVRKTLKISRK